MIEVNKELIHRLTKAQLKHAAAMMLDDHWEYSDDGWDYCQAAADLAHTMLHIDYDDDVKRLTKLLNNPCGEEESLANFACDGVCQEFYDLKPPSLKDD